MEQLTAFAARRGGRAADRGALRQRARQRRAAPPSSSCARRAPACRSPSPTPGWCATGSRWRTRPRWPRTARCSPREGVPLAGPADPAMLTVGELAERIWRGAGRRGRARHRPGRHPARRDAERGARSRPARSSARSATRASRRSTGEIPTAAPGLGRRAAARARRARGGAGRLARGDAAAGPAHAPGPNGRAARLAPQAARATLVTVKVAPSGSASTACMKPGMTS